MTVVVSFSLYGKDPIYSAGAIRNSVMYAKHRPDWHLRFFVGRSVNSETIAEIRKANPLASIMEVDERENSASTWWRYRALFDSPDVFMSRDADSIPSARQRDAEDVWLASGFNGHVIRDFEWHGAIILAGLFGVKGFSVDVVANRIPFKVMNLWTIDQLELQKVFPVIRRITMAHIGCSHIYERIDQRRPLRVPRDPGGFVGQGLLADGSPRFPEHVKPELLLSDEYLLSRPDVFLPEFRKL
jgi:hypothetical protein